MRAPSPTEMRRDLSAWVEAGRPRPDGGMTIVDQLAVCTAFGEALGNACADAIIEETDAALAAVRTR